MAKYAMFVEHPRVLQHSRFESKGERWYIPIECPHCGQIFTRIPEDALKGNKAGKCKHHLETCISAPPPPVLAGAHALEKEREKLERDKERFEEERLSGLKELRDARERLDQDKRDFEQDKREHEQDKREHDRHKRDVDSARERRHDEDREMLWRVMQWAGLKDPKSTVVHQLIQRDAKLEGEIKKKCENAFDLQEAELKRKEAENKSLKCDNKRLKTEASTAARIPPHLMERSDWARRKAMIAFAPDKQPTEETKRLAEPLFKQASSAEPSRSSGAN